MVKLLILRYNLIGTLLYLTVGRIDIISRTNLCVRYQASPKESHIREVKRIFRYLKETPKLGLWYPKDSCFDHVGYTDSDYVDCTLDRESSFDGC